MYDPSTGFDEQTQKAYQAGQNLGLDGKGKPLNVPANVSPESTGETIPGEYTTLEIALAYVRAIAMCAAAAIPLFILILIMFYSPLEQWPIGFILSFGIAWFLPPTVQQLLSKPAYWIVGTLWKVTIKQILIRLNK